MDWFGGFFGAGGAPGGENDLEAGAGNANTKRSRPVNLKAEVALITGYQQVRRVLLMVEPSSRLLGLSAPFLSRLAVILAERCIAAPEGEEVPFIGWLPKGLQEFAAREMAKPNIDTTLKPMRDHEYGQLEESVLPGGKKTAIVLEYLLAEIIEHASALDKRTKEVGVWPEDICAVLDPDKGKDAELRGLFSQRQLEWTLGVCCMPMQGEEGAWYEQEDDRNALIDMWLHCPVDCREPAWQTLHAQYGGYIGVKDMWQDVGPPKSHLVVAEDARGRRHRLIVTWSDGNADANTGIFGRVWQPSEGVWGVFYGHRAGDCGTLVEATQLAIKSYAPHRHLDKLPAGAVWSENSWTRQIEALMFGWAMQSTKEHARHLVPPLFRRRLTRSLLRIVGKHADARIPRDVWDMIADRAEIAVPDFFIESMVHAWVAGERSPEKLQNLRFGLHKNRSDRDQWDETWPKASYEELLSYEEELTTDKGTLEMAQEMLEESDEICLNFDH